MQLDLEHTSFRHFPENTAPSIPAITQEPGSTDTLTASKQAVQFTELMTGAFMVVMMIGYDGLLC